MNGVGSIPAVSPAPLEVTARWERRRPARRLFSDDTARAWVRHNVEEMGCFENFLPTLGGEREHAR
jgi:hypothetical protein